MRFLEILVLQIEVMASAAAPLPTTTCNCYTSWFCLGPFAWSVVLSTFWRVGVNWLSSVAYCTLPVMREVTPLTDGDWP